MSNSDYLDRPSLEKTLEDRYNSEKVGGAYDAKTVGKVFVDNITNTFADGFTKAGANTNLPKKDSIHEIGVGGSTYLSENKHSDLSIKFNKQEEFYIKQSVGPTPLSNFKDVTDTTSNELSKHMRYFKNNRYYVMGTP